MMVGGYEGDTKREVERREREKMEREGGNGGKKTNIWDKKEREEEQVSFKEGRIKEEMMRAKRNV